MATVALKNLNLTIRDREFVILAGPDVAVSEIVRAIAGLAEAPPGEILFDDKPIQDIAPPERDVALLSHDYVPYPRLSVYENLAIGLKQRRFGDAEIKKRIAAVAEAVQIQDQLELSPDSLLPEEREFLGLARAMVRQPRVYLFDRPFANLGSEDASRGRAVISELQQRSSATIIYATNDPPEAMAFATRTVIIAGATVQQDADGQTIYDSPANLRVARFFGDPPMNLVKGTLRATRDAVTFAEAGEGTIALELPFLQAAKDMADRQVILGFRPESVAIAPTPNGSNRPGASFRAVVERAEPKGAQTDLYLRTGAHALICRTAHWERQGGRRLQFTIDPAKTHIFAEETGLRLDPGPCP
jgi:multiple sugar transport system ATP-binding protein